jgi:uncharacterized protein (TIGR03083 family)
MGSPEYLTAIRRESDALAAAAQRGLEPAVPSCPGWTVRDVVGHTGAVHRQKEQIVRERWTDGGPDLVEPPATDLIEWFLAGSGMLLETLADTNPLIPVYSWYPPDQSVGFWCRRMAHETAIHRVDAELGHGIVNPVEPALASDGIDEVLTVMIEGYPEWATPTATDETLRIECTDQPGSWSMRFITWSGAGPESGTVYRDQPGIVLDESARAASVIRGSACDLDLFLWGRAQKGRLALVGDTSLVDRLRDIAADATR